MEIVHSFIRDNPIGVELAMVLIVALITYLGYRFVRRAIIFLIKKAAVPDIAFKPLIRGLQYTASLVFVFVVLGRLGFNVNGAWAALSAVLATLAIGFVAVWSIMSNPLCTVILIAFKPFTIG